MKYRIKYEDGWFYPQYKFLWWFFNFEDYVVKVKFATLDAAKCFITKQIQSNIKQKVRYYEYK